MPSQGILFTKKDCNKNDKYCFLPAECLRVNSEFAVGVIYIWCEVILHWTSLRSIYCKVS